MDAADTSAAIVAAARSWIGTPYHHHARVHGVGVDCAQLLLAVYQPFGIAADIDPGHYAPDWHLHRSEELYQAWLHAAGAHQVSDPAPGDVGLWQFGRTHSHSAICVGPDTWVHAIAKPGRVIESLGTEAPLAGHNAIYWRVLPDQEAR